MKRTILLLFLFISISVHSQTREELVQQLVVHFNAEEYDKALPLARKVAEMAEKEMGESDPEYAAALSDLGIILSRVGEHEEALNVLKQSATIRKVALGEAHPDYLRTLYDIATGSKNVGDFQEAERCYQILVETFRLLEGPNSKNYLKYLSEFGLMYLSSGQFAEAEKYLLLAEPITRKLYGTGHAEYANIVSGLGVLYLNQARYDKAESFLLTAHQINKNGGDSRYISTSYSNLGYLYFVIGQFEKAEEYYLESKALLHQNGDSSSVEYSTLLGNIGVLYTEMEEYEKALQSFREASKLRKGLYGTEHPEYGLSLHNIASVYIYMEKLDTAELLLKEVMRIYRKSWGTENHEYANSLTNLAALYFEQKQPEKAEPLLLETLEIRKKMFGDNHPDYAASLRNMLVLYSDLGKYEKAEHYVIRQNEVILNFLSATFNYLPEKEREDYLEKNILTLDDNNSFLVNHKKASPELVRSNFEQLLFLKSLSLSGSQHMLEALRTIQDVRTREQYASWLEKKKQLAVLLTQPASETKDERKKVEKEAIDLEKSLMQLSSAFRDQQSGSTLKMSDIQQKMKDDEAVVEFVRFDYYDKGWTDSVLYAAYVLRRNDQVPVFISLFEEKQLQALFDSAGTTTVEQANSFYRSLKKKNQNAGVIGEKLYRLVWQPLEKELKGIKKIAYSPAGLLYNIALHAIPVDSNTVLLDKYEMAQYTSTRLLAKRDEIKDGDSPDVILFGDPVFGGGTNAGQDSATSTSYGKRGGRDSWSTLPGTATEVKAIGALFSAGGKKNVSFTGSDASEEKFKLLHQRSPLILHIATHGFFLPSPEKRKKDGGISLNNSYSNAENPLMRSGLVFAGANYAWSGKQVEQGEDGIATAYEISQLDLSNTNLVVLSACETALGDVKGSEGVFGLQRAFKMAGVKKMIVSLWQVPDKETAELMTAFYSYFLSGKTIEEAFSRAQSDMRKKYSPFYWAAFVLVE